MTVDNDSKFGVMFSRTPLDFKREYKKPLGLLQWKRHFKLELCDYSMLVKLYKIGEVHIVWYEWFSCKGWEWQIYYVVIRTSTAKISRLHLADNVNKFH